MSTKIQSKSSHQPILEIKKAVYKQIHTNLNELKQCYKEEWSKVPSQRYERLKKNKRDNNYEGRFSFVQDFIESCETSRFHDCTRKHSTPTHYKDAEKMLL